MKGEAIDDLRAWLALAVVLVSGCAAPQPASSPETEPMPTSGQRTDAVPARPSSSRPVGASLPTSGPGWRQIATPQNGWSAADTQWIEIDAPDGYTLRAAVTRPAGDDPVPVIVYLHASSGFQAGEARGATTDFAAAGFMVVAGCWFAGYSPLDARDPTRLIECPTGPPFAGSNPGSIAYANALVKVARELPRADPRRVGLTGASRGATAALLLASLGSDVQAVVADSADYTRAGRPSSVDLPPIRSVAALAAPVLLLHGSADATIPIQEARDYETALRRHGKVFETKYLEGAEHVLRQRSRPYLAEVVSTVNAFFDKYLAKAPVLARASAVPAATPRPRSPSTGTSPARGQLLYETRFDETGSAIVSTRETGASGATELRHAAGALEYRGSASNTGRQVQLEPFVGPRYVGEVEVSFGPEGNARFGWIVRTATPGGSFQVMLDPGNDNAQVRYFRSRSGASEQVVPVTSVQMSSSVVLAVSVDRQRVAVFIDGRDLFSFGHADIRQAPEAPLLIFSGAGSARISAARFYDPP